MALGDLSYLCTRQNKAHSFAIDIGKIFYHRINIYFKEYYSHRVKY